MAQKNFTLVTLATAATAATAGQKEFKKLILREPSRTVCHKEGGNIFCGIWSQVLLTCPQPVGTVGKNAFRNLVLDLSA